jgi:hypothetical protein
MSCPLAHIYVGTALLLGDPVRIGISVRRTGCAVLPARLRAHLSHIIQPEDFRMAPSAGSLGRAVRPPAYSGGYFSDTDSVCPRIFSPRRSFRTPNRRYGSSVLACPLDTWLTPASDGTSWSASSLAGD